MKILIYQIDAFTSKVFSGNPAAVCPLDKWLDDSILQAIAQENNLSETAFFVPEEKKFHIRWFTPVAEIDLCGHATLAAAFVIFSYFFRYLEVSDNEIVFTSRSGELKVSKQDQDRGEGEDQHLKRRRRWKGMRHQYEGLLSMDFPSRASLPCSAPPDLVEGLLGGSQGGRQGVLGGGLQEGLEGKLHGGLYAGLHAEPLEVLCSADDYFVIFRNESDIRGLNPDMGKLRRLGLRGVIVTAKGDDSDFVSRFFAPKFGIDEDPVTGSAHCALTPYWARKLNKENLYARQLSARGGELYCIDRGDRVVISGRVVKYMEGTISL